MHQYGFMRLAQDFATDYFEKNSKPDLIFHHIGHTAEVVQAVTEIGSHYTLSAVEAESVIIAAWFHDLGYCHTYKGHELYSENIAEEFLRNNNRSSVQIELVLGCIGATKIPQQPLNLIQMILCDADFYHFSREDYPAHEQALRAEWELNLNRYYPDHEWDSINHELLKTHIYFTSYGQEILQIRKEENIRILEKKISG